MKTRRLRRERLYPCFVTVLGVAVQACGGAAPPAAETKSPASGARTADETDEAEPQTIEQAEARIERLRLSLSSMNASRPETESTSKEPPAPPPVARPQGGVESRSENADKWSGGSSGGSCVAPCRALSSMRRAVEALCRMAGEADARCVDAKRTLDESTARTSACQCH